MCGVIGVWERGSGRRQTTREDVVESLGSLRHRGPDDQGVWECVRGGPILGHTRLSILDLTSHGRQPMQSNDGGYLITFNGEIYNHLELRSELESGGVVFESHSDTEVVLNGYARWGREVLNKLVGMFAFAIWDVRDRTLFLARDRMGEKPLYFASRGSAFAFASEIQPLRRLRWVDGDVDRHAVSLYLEHQYIPAPHSICKGIRKLPAGHAMAVTSNGMETWRYWDPLAIVLRGQRQVNESEALEELSGLLGRAVRQQMLSDVPLGAFLSGGIDSSAVVATMVEASAERVKTFTIGFDDPQFNEADHAARVAEALGTDHTVEYLSESDALALVPRIPGIYGEPFADSSALPTLLVSTSARRHVTVSLSGDGGDELFGGYLRYDRYETFARIAEMLGPALGYAAVLARHLPGRIGRLAAIAGSASKSDTYHPFVSTFTRDEAERLTGIHQPVYDEYARLWGGTVGLSARRRAMITDLQTYLPEAILTKVDRASMAVSLEMRAPFLDHRIVEWSLGLPQPLVQNKHLLKQLAYRKVGRELLDRPKRGFGVPLGKWFRGELREALSSALEPDRLERVGVSGDGMVARMLTEHQNHVRNHSSRLWALFVLSHWGLQGGL